MKTFYLSLISVLAFGASFSITKAQTPTSTSPPLSAETTHVVELFTSQGCSSCPPANRTVSKIAEKPGVLALTYGVTYWDYLGWKDTFGDPKFTDRQRDYQAALDGANLYTPQIVLNGTSHSPRYSEKDILSMPLFKDGYVSSIRSNNEAFVLTSDLPAGANIALVTYMPGEQDVDVKRGENGGQTLRLSNVVTDIAHMEWQGQAISLPITAQSNSAYAALFHDKGTAKIISVATYNPAP